jgi:methyl-accepting chemotaxis protein
MFFRAKVTRIWHFFVKKDVRKKFILLYVLCVLGPAGLAVLSLYLVARLELEKILYSSHLKISDSGEIFSGLMIKTNLISSFFIVVLIILLSLYFFRRLNTNFHRMEERFAAMGQGDFSLPAQQLSSFNEISSLIELSEQTRQNYRQRFAELDQLLGKLGDGLAAEASAVELRDLGDKLAVHLRRVNLPEELEPSEG